MIAHVADWPFGPFSVRVLVLAKRHGTGPKGLWATPYLGSQEALTASKAVTLVSGRGAISRKATMLEGQPKIFEVKVWKRMLDDA